MGALDFLFGSKGKNKRVDTMTGAQKDFQSNLLEMLGGGQGGTTGQGFDYLRQILGGDDQSFADFEAPYKRQFEQQTMPGIAERFAGLGTGGALSSSGMNQSLAQGGRELSEKLAAMRAGLKQNALSSLQGFINPSMQRSYENVYQQPTQGLIPGIAGSLMGGLGGGFGEQMGRNYASGGQQGQGASGGSFLPF